MAFLHECKVCKGNVTDREMHPECEIAFLQDLLYQIQTHIKLTEQVNQVIPFPEQLIQEMKSTTFSSLAEYEIRKRKQVELNSQQATWELGLAQYMNDAGMEFRSKYPEPKPVMF